MAMHRMQQRQLPLVLVGAGLPILPGLAGESKSYAERLFNFPAVGPLPEPDAARALQDPVQAEGVAFEPDALHEIFRLTQGYPYFLQEWGYQAWNHAEASPIGADVVRETSELVSRRRRKSAHWRCRPSAWAAPFWATGSTGPTVRTSSPTV
jgi:hypothetical protein